MIHDYLVSESVVGDWEGQEELVAEKLNEIYHTLYDLAEEDIVPDELINLLELVWHIWIGQDELPDIISDDIHDWCRNVLDNRDQYLEELN
ncbi:MAG: hypothetical protein ACSHW0_15565 [Thalassotalea sp.]